MNPAGSQLLTLERALIFRITHVDNLPWLLTHGAHCSSSPEKDPSFISIGNPELIEKRRKRDVPIAPGGTLEDYVPFYFTPFTPMLLNIKTGYNGIVRRAMEDIVVLRTSLHVLAAQRIPFVFSDRHAYLRMARFSSSIADLGRIDWAILQRRDFKRDPEDPEKFERYQAEALIHRHLPCGAIQKILCATERRRQEISATVTAAGLQLRVAAQPDMFF